MGARRAVIVDVVRTPFGRGREGGALAQVHPVNLYAHVLERLVERTGVDPHLVEDVISGCVIQVAEQSGNIGRQAVLAAGLPESVPAVTLDRKCGSAQQAMDFAAQGVIAGAYDVVIAGGVEMMSVVPMPAWPLDRKPRSSSTCRARLVPARTACSLLHPPACSCLGPARVCGVSPSPATSCPPAPGAPQAASVACSPILPNMAALAVVRCVCRCPYMLARLCLISSGHCIAGDGSARPPPA